MNFASRFASCVEIAYVVWNVSAPLTLTSSVRTWDRSGSEESAVTVTSTA
ncbi:MAG: hypothetical protein ACXVDD_09540 [Polyangia bacterium]